MDDLRKLRHALVLAEERSFSEASRKLHLTQPGLTRSIQALGSELGLKLFDRSRAGISITPAGSKVLERARALLLQARGLRQDVELIKGGDLGDVGIGAGPMFVPLLGPLLAGLAQRVPGLSVRVEIKPAFQLGEHLLREELDFFIADASQLHLSAMMATEPLGQLPVGYFVRADHPLTRARAITLQALQRFALASPAYRGDGFSNTPGDLPSPLTRVRWRGHISCEHVSSLKEVALHADAVLLAADFTLQPELDEGRLVKLDWPSSGLGQLDWRLVRLAERDPSPAASLTVAMLKEIFARETGTGAVS